jgi:dolichyl-phosphate-mannose--protein O-mannosyl transferase
LFEVAAAVALAHLLTNQRYGFHRDELQFLSDARHLTWGYVAYPPLTPFLERIQLGLFGVSLEGLRLFSVLAQSVALVFTGLIARELGGGRLAQATAALCVALAPLPLFNGTDSSTPASTFCGG